MTKLPGFNEDEDEEEVEVAVSMEVVLTVEVMVLADELILIEEKADDVGDDVGTIENDGDEDEDGKYDEEENS
ncbi:unnamed protein product [[Candida] boidinii]|nr:unnamed protein product [[Candida] boidinii]GMF99615.1 unnamed protein product [[Candida] boidinii]